jgi:ABC-type multidrug transport system ATPase subunit
VKVESLTFSWEGEHGHSIPTLRNVSFQAVPGGILGLAGPVGSGKTTLLLAILGELAGSDEAAVTAAMTAAKPAVVVTPPGPIAYAAQEPWILTGSVRDNIVMGRPFDAERYRAVLKAACLATDLEQWEHGDHTVIGDRGVNMSGGQKARIGLARMAYGDAALYLIDDALSALDPKVGRRVFDRLICGLLRGKTRVLATHQLQYLLNDAEVPRVLFLNRGKLRAEGTLADLAARGYFKDLHLPPATATTTPTGAVAGTGAGAATAATTAVGAPELNREESASSMGSTASAHGDLVRLEAHSREQNLPPTMPDPEPVFYDMENQETITPDRALELAALITREQEAARGGGAAQSGIIPPLSPAAAAWVRFRTRSRQQKTPKGGPSSNSSNSSSGSGGASASARPRGHFSAEPDNDNDDEAAHGDKTTAEGASTPSRMSRARTVSIAVVTRQQQPNPRRPDLSLNPNSIAFASAVDSPAASSSSVSVPLLSRGHGRTRSVGAMKLNTGMMPSPALSAHSVARAARAARSSLSSMPLALPFIDDSHDGGLALATEGQDDMMCVAVCLWQSVGGGGEGLGIASVHGGKRC